MRRAGVRRTPRRWLFLALALALVSVSSVAGCGRDQRATELRMAPATELPADLQRAPAAVQEAYRFAIANQELLEQIPCFCGCVAGGHRSNYNCYVSADGGPGAVRKLDSHALG